MVVVTAGDGAAEFTVVTVNVSDLVPLKERSLTVRSQDPLAFVRQVTVSPVESVIRTSAFATGDPPLVTWRVVEALHVRQLPFRWLVQVERLDPNDPVKALAVVVVVGAAVVVVGAAVVGGVVVVADDGAVVVVELVGTGAAVVLVGSIDLARQLAGWGRWDTHAEVLATWLEALFPANLMAPRARPPTSAVRRAYSTSVAPLSRRPLRVRSFFKARTSNCLSRGGSDRALPARNGHRRSFQE
jgi:hypothetical protein